MDALTIRRLASFSGSRWTVSRLWFSLFRYSSIKVLASCACGSSTGSRSIGLIPMVTSVTGIRQSGCRNPTATRLLLDLGAALVNVLALDALQLGDREVTEQFPALSERIRYFAIRIPLTDILLLERVRKGEVPAVLHTQGRLSDDRNQPAQIAPLGVERV